MSNNNEWVDPLLDAIWDEACDSMEDGGTADITRGQARLAILSKLESIEQEAKVDVWQEVDNLALGYRSYRMSDVAQERLRQLKGKG